MSSGPDNALTMTLRSLKILTATSWSVILLCAVVFLYFAIAIPNVISMSIVSNKDKNVREIRSSTDLRQVQEIAAWHTEQEAYVTDAASVLLAISVVTMLLCMGCSAISLSEIRRLRRELDEKSTP